MPGKAVDKVMDEAREFDRGRVVDCWPRRGEGEHQPHPQSVAVENMEIQESAKLE